MKFVGHGGTSAGSIVALMASVGYGGQDLEKILVEELDFRSLLEDNGQRLATVQKKATQISSMLAAGGLDKLWAVNVTAPSVLSDLGTGLGLYQGTELKKFLIGKIKARVPALADHTDITFEHLHKAGCLPLKIVASDIRIPLSCHFRVERHKVRGLRDRRGSRIPLATPLHSSSFFKRPAAG